MMEMTRIVMKFAPIGIFCLMAKTFASLGFGGISTNQIYWMCSFRSSNTGIFSISVTTDNFYKVESDQIL